MPDLPECLRVYCLLVHCDTQSSDRHRETGFLHISPLFPRVHASKTIISFKYLISCC